MLVGVYAALEVMGVARAVLSVVGLAGAVALALSFAFRDFAENFIASLLLGVRRPFRVGDFVGSPAQSGVVRALNDPGDDPGDARRAPGPHPERDGVQERRR